MTIPNYRDQIKVVFFDIDDTLFMKQRDFLPATVPVFMRKLKENGIIPAIATGRTRCAFPHKLNQVIEQEGIDLFVTMNGQMASYRGQVIEKHVIPTEKIRRLVHFLSNIICLMRLCRIIRSRFRSGIQWYSSRWIRS